MLAARAGMTAGQVNRIRQCGQQGLLRDKRLRELMDVNDAMCFRYRGVSAFNRDWTSVTEMAALWMIGNKSQGSRA